MPSLTAVIQSFTVVGLQIFYSFLLSQGCRKCGKRFSESEEPIHHCRSCGEGVCDDCSQGKMPVPERGWGDAPVRVCDICYENKTSKEALSLPRLSLKNNLKISLVKKNIPFHSVEMWEAIVRVNYLCYECK